MTDRTKVDSTYTKERQTTKVIFVSMLACGSCRKMQNAMEYAGIEVDEHKIIDPSNEEDLKFTQQYNLQSFPVLLKLDDSNREVSRLCGLQALSRVKEFIGVANV